jgi:hypothetical protein
MRVIAGGEDWLANEENNGSKPWSRDGQPEKL